MERVWRRMNQGLSNKSKSTSSTVRSNNTSSSAAFGEVQNVTAVPNLDTAFSLGISTPTGRRLATSGQQSLSQRVSNTASSERRKRRRKCRPRRSRDRSSSRTQNSLPNAKTQSSAQDNQGQSADTKQDEGEVIVKANESNLLQLPHQPVAPPGVSSDASLKERAVAKLRLFNFHLNWDLHISQCKPCRPRSSGNILTRRLCRNRRREDNELYRSNSFKFERFDRKDGKDHAEMLRKQISVCDDYSLPIDFVKKRPSSYDPSLADKLIDKWSVPSPLSEHLSFLQSAVTITNPPQIIKLVEGYSDPKDSRSVKKYHRNKFCRDKRVHYSSNSSVPNTSTDDDSISNKFPELNSPDSISEDLLRPLKTNKSSRKIQAPDTCKRNPSPYYYSDLLKSKEVKQEDISVTRQSVTSEPPQSTTDSFSFVNCKKSCSLDIPEVEREVLTPKRYSITEGGVRIIRCDSPSTTTSEDSNCSECEKRRKWHLNALQLVTESCPVADTIENTAILSDTDNLEQYRKDVPMPPHRLLGPAVCACTAPAIGEDFDELFRPRSIFYVHQQGVHECVDCAVNKASDKSTNTDTREEDMSIVKTRQIYETAFDCKISRSDDDLDDVDRLTSQSAMLKLINENPSEKISKPRTEVRKSKNARSHVKKNTLGLITTLSQNLEDTHIDENFTKIHNVNSSASPHTTARKYTQSPPSTAPLPIKFPGKHDQDRILMNSIKSAPNLPVSNISKSAFSDLSLSKKSTRQQNVVPTETDGGRVGTSYEAVPRSGSRPRSIVLESGRVVELRSSHRSRQRRGQNYSSTESMATSSSGGSMESLKSSTSEGNRSTTSSESRHSTSLSSHSSDSGNISLPLRVPVALHSKLHILSPISDKSSQEPASETSEINQIRTCNSQSNSPTSVTQGINSTDMSRPNELLIDPIHKQQKRKTFANKTLLHLADEIIGSDSGISLHSREERKSTQTALRKFALPALNVSTAVTNTQLAIGLPQDLHDLPFEMPKLRRRKFLLQQENCTSGSATSVDLGDLPFDMPKLRRRLRMNQGTVSNLVVRSTESSGISQASSSHSVRDDHKHIISGATMFRPNLTLNLNEAKPANKFGSLDLKGAPSRELNLNIGNTTFFTAADLIDITVPLERQGWYHGSITRVEAENTLRPLSEGTFLVRNCESTKQDYSLSLKSAKGFMHMRIQRNESGQYILGQFSRPFQSVPEMIRHFCLNRLPVRGAEHMCLLDPVIAQLL